MKRNLILLFVFSISCLSYGQQLNKNQCENYNAYFKTGNYESLEVLAHEISPNGSVYFNPEKVKEYGQQAILEKIGIQEETSFQLVRSSQSNFNEQKVYRRFQQYHNGVKVEDGGYTVASNITNGNPSAPDPGWDGPCDAVAMISFFVFTGIEIETTPQIQENQIPEILTVPSIKRAELVITHNIRDECNFNLAWKVYYDDDASKIAYIDALSGILIIEYDGNQYLTAPTEIYGNRNLDDYALLGGGASLMSPDAKIKAYDFSSFTTCSQIDATDYQSNLIPTTSNASWSSNQAPESVLQGFYVTSKARNYLSNININFNNIHIGVNCSQNSAAYLRVDSDINDTYLRIGESTNGSSLSTFDIVGHELGHAILEDRNITLLGYGGIIHEGISDMYGTYIEYKHQGFVDWEMGDDINYGGRDLQFPKYDCWTEYIDDLGKHVYELDIFHIHDMSTPLGHWFYLITEGSSTHNIPALGIEKSIRIVTDALNLMPVYTLMDDAKDATLNLVIQDFGRCSPEFIAVARAWEAICLNTGYVNASGRIETCDITGPSFVCEETDAATFCVQGGLPNAHYRWTIIGNKSTQYTSLIGMQGNIQHGGTCLSLTDFPKLDYYPQTVTIKIYSPTAGNQFFNSITKTVQLIDCNGDDPTCDEFYSMVEQPIDEYEAIAQELRIQNLNNEFEEPHFIKVYDASGLLLHSKNYTNFDSNQLPSNQLFFIVSLGKNGNILDTKKYFRIGY